MNKAQQLLILIEAIKKPKLHSVSAEIHRMEKAVPGYINVVPLVYTELSGVGKQYVNQHPYVAKKFYSYAARSLDRQRNPKKVADQIVKGIEKSARNFLDKSKQMRSK